MKITKEDIKKIIREELKREEDMSDLEIALHGWELALDSLYQADEAGTYWGQGNAARKVLKQLKRKHSIQ